MKILKNYAYNLSYQLLVIILPIITTPYITRIFSSDDLGTYGYFNSIVTYFLLLATLGVANYGTKEISAHRKEIEKNFWGIYSLQFAATWLSILLSLVLCFLLPSMQNPVAYILGLSLVSKGLDISWLFQGLEDFRKITVRNITVKLVGVISIFLFVKSANDLYLYVFLLTIFELLGQLSMWLPARQFIGKLYFDWKYAKKHLKPVILLFLSQIAISLYVTLDRTMLGLKAIEANMNTFIRTNLGYSNSLFVILAQGGLILGGYYFYPVIKIILGKRYLTNYKMFSVLFIILLTTSIFVGSPLFSLYIGIFYFLISNREYFKEI